MCYTSNRNCRMFNSIMRVKYFNLTLRRITEVNLYELILGVQNEEYEVVTDFRICNKYIVFDYKLFSFFSYCSASLTFCNQLSIFNQIILSDFTI